ncbi:hypothetical protein MASR1M66_01630 [Aminivibrio sp.]
MKRGMILESAHSHKRNIQQRIPNILFSELKKQRTLFLNGKQAGENEKQGKNFFKIFGKQ